MENQYLMGNGDGLTRSASGRSHPTYVSPDLKRRLLVVAIEECVDFFEEFFESTALNRDFSDLAQRYETAFNHAVSLSLFAGGGIREKHHLVFWCLGEFFRPEIYIESGVFTGSSLHAYLSSPDLKEVIGIDPDLSNLRVPYGEIPGAALIDKMDFSQLSLDVGEKKVLTYFDDHINSVDRILQAHEKGLKYLLFDDSTGMEGICQRLYPATPTVPMIMRSELYSVGDEISWTFRAGDQSNYVVNLVVTKEMLAGCQKAKSLVKKYSKLPEMGDFVPQLAPEKLPDTSKYILELD